MSAGKVGDVSGGGCAPNVSSNPFRFQGLGLAVAYPVILKSAVIEDCLYEEVVQR